MKSSGISGEPRTVRTSQLNDEILDVVEDSVVNNTRVTFLTKSDKSVRTRHVI